MSRKSKGGNNPRTKRGSTNNGAPFLFVAIIRREKEPPTTQPTQAKHTKNRNKAIKTSEAINTIQANARAEAHKNTGAKPTKIGAKQSTKIGAFRFSLFNRLTLHA